MAHSTTSGARVRPAASKPANGLSRCGLLPVAAAVLILVWFGASQQDVSAQATVALRLANFSDSDSISISLDGQPKAAGLGVGTTGSHELVAAGSHTVKVVGADSGSVLFEGEVQIASDTTLAVVGPVSSTAVLILADDRTLQPSSQAKLRFVHLASDVPAVDLDSRSGPKLASGIAYGTIGDYSVVSAGDYTVDVRLAGQSAVALTLPAVSIRSGQVITYFITGQLSTNNLKVIPVVDNGMASPSAGSGLALDPRAATIPGALLTVGALMILASGLALLRSERA